MDIIFAKMRQNQEKTGDSALPRRLWDKPQPIPRAARYPTRRSPPHTAKPRYTHPQPKAREKTRSAKAVNLGRRGRKNP